MSEPPLMLDDVTQADLRRLAGRLLRASVPLPAPFGFPVPTAEWPGQQ